MRGQKANDGATRVAPNGYHYTKANGKWRLTHHIIAERVLGRPLREDERVSFKDGKRTNLSPNNIVVSEKGQGSIRRRKAQIEARIDELRAELHAIDEELRAGRSGSHSS